MPDEIAPEPVIVRAKGAVAITLPDDTPKVLLHMPVDVRNLSLAVLATLASVFMLRWASAVCIPVLVGLLFSYALSPIVAWLQLRRIPRALSAASLVLAILSGFAATASILVASCSATDEMSALRSTGESAASCALGLRNVK